MPYVVSCPCGVTIRGNDVDKFVKDVQKHAKDVHKQEASREQVLAMARQE